MLDLNACNFTDLSGKGFYGCLIHFKFRPTAYIDSKELLLNLFTSSIDPKKPISSWGMVLLHIVEEMSCLIICLITTFSKVLELQLCKIIHTCTSIYVYI